jgi:PPM family protein phosphatase
MSVAQPAVSMSTKTNVCFPAVRVGPLQGSISGHTHVGQVREDNQDHLHIDPRSRFAIVADGMGGHEGGQLASRLAADAVADVIADALDENAASIHDDTLLRAFQSARDAIEEEALQDEELASMGTTLVLGALTGDGELVIAHMGDSRLYRLREGKLTCLTRDHNVLSELLHAGILSDSQVETNRRLAHLLTRALSPGCVAAPDVARCSPQPGDLFLLCSDGLHGCVDDKEITELLGRDAPSDDICDALIDAALEQGAPDNVTAVLIRVSADSPPTH